MGHDRFSTFLDWAKDLSLEKAIWVLFWAFALGIVVWQLLISIHL